jgi:RNA polymerase sigma-B factor
LASHYWHRCQEPREDLIQVGLLGLIRAAELFHHTGPTPFSAYARPHIRGAILHYLRDDAAAVRLPRRQSERQTRLARLEEEWAGQPAAPSAIHGELERQLGLTLEQWNLLRRHRQLCRPAPLDAELLDQLAAPDEEPQEEGEGNQARVETLLAGLDPRTQQVVRWVVVQGWSYRRAAAAMEVSAMTVQRCLHKGLATLRLQLGDAEGCGSGGQAVVSPRGLRGGRAPSGARGWPSRHSPPPAAAPAHRARR